MRLRLVALLIASLFATAGCGSAKTPPVVSKTYLPASSVAAMAVDPQNGDFYYGNLDTGTIWKGTSAAHIDPRRIATVAVSTDGQRGLLGLAVDPEHRVFASYTAAGGSENIVVAQVSPGDARVVWNGPPSASLANGSRIAFSPDGRLSIGIGDLTDRSKLSDINAPNGKMLSLDPNGVSTQTPRVISSFWNNPYAFAYSPTGALWVGDNEPGNASERLARGDIAGAATHITHIGSHRVGSGIAFGTDGSLYECTYLGRTLQRYTIGSNGTPKKAGKPLVSDCSLGVVAVKDGALIYSTGTELRMVKPR